MGTEPTGNGMRMSLTSTPRATYSTLTLKPGEKTLDEMIAGMDKGIIVDQIMGAHQASMFSGDFSVSVSLGFVVENGKIVGRFKDGMLAGNVFTMLKDQAGFLLLLLHPHIIHAIPADSSPEQKDICQNG